MGSMKRLCEAAASSFFCLGDKHDLRDGNILLYQRLILLTTTASVRWSPVGSMKRLCEIATSSFFCLADKLDLYDGQNVA